MFFSEGQGGDSQVDLQQLFEMIDADGSGAIEAHEFIAPLSRASEADKQRAPSDSFRRTSTFKVLCKVLALSAILGALTTLHVVFVV